MKKTVIAIALGLAALLPAHAAEDYIEKRRSMLEDASGTIRISLLVCHKTGQSDIRFERTGEKVLDCAQEMGRFADEILKGALIVADDGEMHRAAQGYKSTVSSAFTALTLQPGDDRDSYLSRIRLHLQMVDARWADLHMSLYN